MILDRGEVIVVGGGIVGTTTAWFLAERGVDVVLVEQEDLAYGASGRNMGFLVISNRCSGIELDFALHGRSLYEGFSEQLGNTFEYRSSGGLAFFNDEADAALFREFAEERRSVGLTTDYLEPSEVREVAPILTGDVVGGVFCAEDGMIRTPKFVAALGAECARRGVRIHTQTTATRLKRGADGKVIGVETTRGQVLGDRVVWAAGVWSKLLADEGIEINMEIERLGALLTTPIAETVDPVLYGPSIATMYRHFRTLSSFESTYADRQELLSGKFTQNINQIDGGNLMLGCPMDYPNSFEDHPPVDGLMRALNEFRRSCPDLKVGIERVWAGLVPSVKDGLPIIGDIKEAPGLLIATGHEHGNVAGPATGELIAQLVTGEESSFDVERFSPYREGLIAA